MVLCPDVAPISTPIQGVTTGTVASVSRGPSEDRSSGLVSFPIQAGAFILAASVGGIVGGLYRGDGREPKLLTSFLIQQAACKAA